MSSKMTCHSTQVAFAKSHTTPRLAGVTTSALDLAVDLGKQPCKNDRSCTSTSPSMMGSTCVDIEETCAAVVSMALWLQANKV